MKRLASAALAIAAALAAPAAGGPIVHGGGGGYPSGGGGGLPSAPAAGPSGGHHGGGGPIVPSGGGASRTTTIHPSGAAPNAAIIRDPNFNSSFHERFHEHFHGDPFWFTWYGFPYYYYPGPYGYDWFGYYSGPAFYWTRWYNGYFWWYDDADARWMYYDDGAWQAPSPAYGPAPAPAPPVPGVTVISPDGSRMVQVSGSEGEAFLYERAKNGAATFRAFLARGASNARFEGREIVVDLRAGGTARFTRDGKPLAR